MWINFHNYVIVITWAEDIMAIIVRVRGHSPRMSTIIAIISEVTLYNYFISYLPIPFQFNKSTNQNSEFHCYKYLFLLLSSRQFLFYNRKYYPWERSHTVILLQNDFPPTTDMFEGSHTDTLLEIYIVFRPQRCSN